MPDQRFRILLVEDNPGDAFLVRTLLEETGEAFDVEHRSDLASAMAVLNSDGAEALFDVVLLDLTLPDSSGVDTISRIRSCANVAPVVVLTGHKDEELAFEALQHGAEDYLTKEFPDGRTIRRSIRYAIERSRAERALKESEERYRKLVELAPELISVLSGEEIVYMNQQGVTILGAGDSDKLVGRSFMEMVHPSSRETLEEYISRYQNGYPGRADFTIICQRPEGENVELEVSAIAFTHEGAPAMLMLAEDVTEKRKVERQLVQTSKLATLGEMAASVAHEMNQPLNVIRMAADTCALQYELNAVKPAFQKERLSLISSQTERMSEIIKHLQIYSRPDDDDFAPFDVMKAVERAVDMVEHDCRLSGIAIDVVPPRQRCFVNGRQVQLEQVLVNMLSNARDAINENGDDAGSIGGLIRVSAMIDDAGKTLKLAVNDNGGGVPEAAIDLLFHPFFTTKDVGKGTGLGLSVSFGIVEAMGGRIEVRNEGDGACFEITLPLVDIGVTEDDAISESMLDNGWLSSLPTNAKARGNIRVLVVDDELDAMEIISGYLEAQGFNVSAASNGEDALALAGVFQPDILITDIRMPQMDGNSLVRELRDRNPALPVIVMTGHPGDAEKPVEDEEGSDAPVMVMSKPLNLRELLATLDELCEVFAV
ncbi:response regulator [Thalassospira sp.]|uniref:hybrid sensor histidine kinase/response regulator n=1 Tax=Thalassospira sp. TaxID=1912094 RepID=UPI001AFE51DB|nr:response regulator [Thalassospira sp.]MBO6805552.1 response regulator [Thalassospira sp.]MBO6841322.1 response regulator [Thalassospira sp.]